MKTQPKKKKIVRKPPTFSPATLAKKAAREIELEEKKRIFIKTLAETAKVAVAVEAGGLSHVSFYTFREKDPVFAKLWDEAVDVGCDKLVDEATRRAHDGVLEPVFYKGEVVGEIRKYSDNLLMFLIKKIRPEYRDNSKQTHDGNVDVTFRWRTDNDGDNNPVSTP